MPHATHEPDEQSRERVAIMAGSGMHQDKIARCVGISLPTLHKYYREELDRGADVLEGGVRGNLGAKALAGDNACMFFLLKTRFGDRERFAVGGDAEAPPVQIDAKVSHAATEALGALLGQLATAKANGAE